MKKVLFCIVLIGVFLSSSCLKKPANEERIWLDIEPGLFANGKTYTRETDEETGYRFFKRCRIIWSEKKMP